MCLSAKEEYEVVIEEFDSIWEKTFKATKPTSGVATRAAFDKKMDIFRYFIFLLIYG